MCVRPRAPPPDRTSPTLGRGFAVSAGGDDCACAGRANPSAMETTANAGTNHRRFMLAEAWKTAALRCAIIAIDSTIDCRERAATLQSSRHSVALGLRGPD